MKIYVAYTVFSALFTSVFLVDALRQHTSVRHQRNTKPTVLLKATPNPPPTLRPTPKPTPAPKSKPTAKPTIPAPKSKPTPKPTIPRRHSLTTPKPTATPAPKPIATPAPTHRPTLTPTHKPTSRREPVGNRSRPSREHHSRVDLRLPGRATRGVLSNAMKLTRYIHQDDEPSLPWIRAKERLIKVRVDGERRLSNPFEHTCGGNQERNRTLGHDGLSNFISFSNAEEYPEVAEDCVQNWDKGQTRIRKVIKQVKKNKVIDMSDYSKAFKWCYSGGAMRTQEGKKLRFEGAKTIKPWPYKCAKSVYQTERLKSWGAPPPEWWTRENRVKVAEKCAEWASLSHEVLLLPDPDKILRHEWRNAVFVEIDRPRAKKLCIASLEDRCVEFNLTTNRVCCCSNPDCGTPCPRGPGI